jgi:FAD/FMN-containing dehydrogenase
MFHMAAVAADEPAPFQLVRWRQSRSSGKVAAMVSQTFSSWGNLVRSSSVVYALRSRYDEFPTIPVGSTILPHGNGRSYGDSCLNPGGALLLTRSLDRFIAFDRDAGLITCEGGVLLADILQLTVPAGWFLAVVPGTSAVTVGGAIANDVHGKNHHRAGTFGCHVRQFELLRSNGQRLTCTPETNTDWFEATIGGLGLTGFITCAQLQLRRIPGAGMDLEIARFANLDEFFRLSELSDQNFEYTVAWVDCLSRGKSLGRGLFQRANHSARPMAHPKLRLGHVAVPFTAPFSLVNAATLRLFNFLYYHRPGATRRRRESFESFFFPLDGVADWNRLYGPRGFYQYQCVIPGQAGPEMTARLLERIARSGQGSFLAVLKQFGTLSSPGMLSFPRCGVTLALDFPNTGAQIERLFRELDEIVVGAGGRLYPAKDARMPGELFRNTYPLWGEFARYVDPVFSSGFWRRVTEGEVARNGGGPATECT